MKAVVAAFNQEKALVGAFSVLTNLRMEFFQALIATVSSTPENIWLPAGLGVRAAGRGGGGGRGYDGGGVPGDQPRPGHCRLL